MSEPRETYRNPEPCKRHGINSCLGCDNQIPVPTHGTEPERKEFVVPENFKELAEKVAEIQSENADATPEEIEAWADKIAEDVTAPTPPETGLVERVARIHARYARQNPEQIMAEDEAEARETIEEVAETLRSEGARHVVGSKKHRAFFGTAQWLSTQLKGGQ